jgi:hypothetical protein
MGLALMGLGAAPAWAEDPLLGEIKLIKCVNCIPGWVTLVIHDPIELRDFEILAKDSAYNKIVTPLPGKRIFDRDGACFYWVDAPKSIPKPDTAVKTDSIPDVAQPAPMGKPSACVPFTKPPAAKPAKGHG